MRADNYGRPFQMSTGSGGKSSISGKSSSSGSHPPRGNELARDDCAGMGGQFRVEYAPIPLKSMQGVLILHFLHPNLFNRSFAVRAEKNSLNSTQKNIQHSLIQELPVLPRGLYPEP